MKQFLFYGNCQVFSVLKTLSLPKNYSISHVECFSTNITESDFLNIIKKSDIIITQPINDNYRNLPHLSTKFILDNKSENCIVIFFDSCYFNFYYPDLTYKTINDELLTTPSHYHYNKLIEYYNNKKTIEEYMNDVVNNVDFLECEYLVEMANNSLSELLNRHFKMKEKYSGKNIYFISTHDFIKSNYKQKLLFYSMNHPSKHLIQHICLQICELLQLNHNIDMNIDTLANSVRCILYKCMQKCVDFNIHEQMPLLNNNTTNVDIAKLYFNSYESSFANEVIP